MTDKWEKGVQLICTAHRVPSPETQQSMKDSGCNFMSCSGVSDTALARNIAIEQVLQRAKKSAADVIVFCDDDMQFTPGDVQELVAIARQTSEAVSALYILANGQAAAQNVSTGETYLEARWYTGLGLIAIPTHRLLELRDKSEPLAPIALPDFHAYTWSGPNKGRWMSEDMKLCERLGGVILAPVRVGHVKPKALYPDPEAANFVERGGRKFDAAGLQPVSDNYPQQKTATYP